MDEAAWRGGLAEHYDYMLTEKPEDPNMRESASVWIFEENGEFAFPRNGLEAIGSVWENHRYDCNFAFADGRALFESKFDGASHSPIGPDGRATILGSGGLQFECVEPYKRWKVRYEGTPIDTTSADIAAGTVDRERTTPLRYEVDLTMVAPAWVQDNTPEALARMSERERTDAGLMGFGYRMEQLFRGEGTLWLDGKERKFKAVGNRIHRQSVRPLEAFRGHCWQAAVFPDGRAFGYIAYPPAEDGSTYNEGYVYQDGKWYPATATTIPWLSDLDPTGGNTSLELQSELGITRIEGAGCLNTFKVGSEGELAGFALNQGGTKYTWDGQTAYGMIERSTWLNKVGS
ncbi:hypothetical protein [Novosphingobium sp. JCM 18896]|uniref:DUF7064 domain-containing protein n=1 Tax=Novosphingobium sp. JCM 18896 TaxID=2989731 RepID=UPI002223072E|nr:hypothetical protein [Novosphingobium sp. JCM 18896]MCW1430976.1 hypothetical protein [Novosphingobium sp. JCM 18896]